jgi:serine/threonine protein kinase
MPDESPSSPSDPLFGNHPSNLMRGAMDPTQPVTDPRNWQPPAPETLQATLPGYEVQAFVARGGMGAVYCGMQVSLGRKVAIKILPPLLRDSDHSFAERFKQEARAMAQLNHPGIVSVYDFGEMQDGTLYFIMEFIDGTDVAQMVCQQGRLSSAHAMAITAHVCDALQYAHEHGVVHRDIKPANIMVGYDGSVKVADFGLAKSVHQQNTSLTVSGHVMGTPHFVAPEALTLGMGIDHRADIYAVGVMLYQMLTGKLPQGLFEMPSMQVPGLDPRYDAIVAAAMREDRDQRYQKILDMRHALDAILTQPVMRSEVAKQTITPNAKPRATAPRNPQLGQRTAQPPSSSTRSSGEAKSSAGKWIVITALVLGLGVIGWMTRPKSASQHSTVETNPVTAASPADAKRGHLADLIVPYAPFKAATAAEAISFLESSSRHLDPDKKGISILADEATRNASVAITMDIKEAKLGDLIEYLARLARWQVSYVDDAVRLKSSTSVQPPFPAGTFIRSLQRQGEVVLPAMPFARATLEEAAEFIREKGKQEDPLNQHINLLIDPALGGLGTTITADMKNVTVSAALTHIADLCGGEVAYVGEAFYIQPTAKSLSSGDPSPGRTSGAESSPKAGVGATPPATATKDNPFINSLGMKFVPVPGTTILMCTHETRRQDYAAYALQVPGVPGSWKTMGFMGQPSGHEDNHPVVGVNWDDANGFCQWLKQHERLTYRLPTDQEWSIAAGLQEEHSPKTTPEMLDHLILNHFPWDGSKPPKEVSMAGNYVDTAYIETFKTDPKRLEGVFVLGHTDGFPTTAPVMSFRPNALGLYDLGGNVREWCADWYHTAKQWRVLRGSSWQGFRQEDLLTSGRAHMIPQSRREDCGFRCVLEKDASHF